MGSVLFMGCMVCPPSFSAPSKQSHTSPAPSPSPWWVASFQWAAFSSWTWSPSFSTAAGGTAYFLPAAQPVSSRGRSCSGAGWGGCWSCWNCALRTPGGCCQPSPAASPSWASARPVRPRTPPWWSRHRPSSASPAASRISSCRTSCGTRALRW